jgi:hypothetical protein
MDDFRRNPCRFHLFEVFAVDRSETDLRTLRAAVQTARDRLRYGRIVARDGTELELTEAQLNALESELLDPLRRLRAEQLVHREHPFTRDPELATLLGELQDEELDPFPPLLADARTELLTAVLDVFLPTYHPPPLPDDLPWPPDPEPLELHREPPEEAILRDR